MSVEILNVRRAQVSDIEALHNLVNSAYRGDSSRQGWTTEADLLDGQRIDPEGLRLIIENPDAALLIALAPQAIPSLTPALGTALPILGCVHLEKKDGLCYLGMLTVKPTLQNSGLGKKILTASEDFARTQWKSAEIFMNVITTRAELISWYERRGYSQTRERKSFPMDDPKFGIPKADVITFMIMRKKLR